MTAPFKKGRFGLGAKYISVVFVSVLLVGATMMTFTYMSLDNLRNGIKDELINRKSADAARPLIDALKERVKAEAEPYAKQQFLKPAPDALQAMKDEFFKNKNFSYVIFRDKDRKPDLELSFSIIPNFVARLKEATALKTMQTFENGAIMQAAFDNSRFVEIIFPIGADPAKAPDGLISFGYSLNEIDGHVLTVKQGYEETARDVQTLVSDKIEQIQYYGMLLALMILVVSTGVAYMLSSRMLRPIKNLEQTMKKIENEHDLTPTVTATSRDEVGSLANTMNSMISKLKNIVGSVQEASLHVGSSSTELLAAAEQISKGAKNQAKNIEDTSSAVTELTASINEVAASAKNASETANRGTNAVNDVNEKMARIKKSVADTSEKIKELGTRSKEIGKIVSVITQISDQTSLLALNAAIEAARAGEHGRGFAVVADEVSKLAVKASASAKEIDELVNDIRERTEQSVAAMSNAIADVENGSISVNAAGTNFLDIVQFVQETASAVQEQATAFQEISTSINEVLNISKETVVASEEAVGQGNELRELAEKLDDIIKLFKIYDQNHKEPPKGK